MTSTEEDERTWRQYNKDTGDDITLDHYEALRTLWRVLGGQFYGPNVEHGTMPESKLLPLLKEYAFLLAHQK